MRPRPTWKKAAHDPVRRSRLTPSRGTSTPGRFAVKFAVEFTIPYRKSRRSSAKTCALTHSIMRRRGLWSGGTISLADAHRVHASDLNQIRIKSTVVKQVADLVEAIGQGSFARGFRHPEPNQATSLSNRPHQRHAFPDYQLRRTQPALTIWAPKNVI